MLRFARRFPNPSLSCIGILALLGSAFAPAAESVFSDPLIVKTAHRADYVVAGDFDGDLTGDVAALDAQTGDVEVRFGDGDGGYRPASAKFKITTSNNNYRGVAVADLDGDGQPELVFAAGKSVLIYACQNDLTFALTRTIDLSAKFIDATKVAVGDLTAAGSRDIVVADDYGSKGVVWISNDGTGTYGSPKTFPAGGIGYYARLLTADLDNDGLDDVILARSSGVGVLFTQANGTLEAEDVYTASSLPNYSIRAVTVADIDGDDFLDLVTTGSVGETYYLNVNLNNGNTTFKDSLAFRYPVNEGSRLSANDIAAGVFTGDGKMSLVTPVQVPGTMTTNGYAGFLVTQFTGDATNLTLAQQDAFKIPGGILYGAIAVGDQNGDGSDDVILGTNAMFSGPPSYSQFALFLNGTVTAPTGRKVQFAKTEIDAKEGDELDVTLTRGSDSTGEVLAYFTTGGTAVIGQPGAKSADYSISDPAAAQPVVFAEGENEQTIHLSIANTRGAESEQTVVLTLVNIVGDVEPIDSSHPDPKSTVTITVHDAQPAGLAKPGALTVTPANVLKPLPQTLASLVKVAGRTGSDWTFAVNQALPADVLHAKVVVQTSSAATGNPWVEYGALSHGKGNAWSLVDRYPPLGVPVYFRTVTTVDGYPDQIGTPTQPFAVFAGPELGLYLRAESSSDDTGSTVHSIAPGVNGDAEFITYHFTAVNISRNNTAAAPAVLTVPVPEHTTFGIASTNSANYTEVKDKKGRITAITYTLSSFAKGATFNEDVVVKVDAPDQFKKPNVNGLGYYITLKGYSLSALSQGVVSSPIGYTDFVTKTSELRTQIIGSLKLSVSKSATSVAPGSLITFTFHCQNDSAAALSGSVVYDAIPSGTQLAQVYSFDSSGNGVSTPLTNPGAKTNPAIVYAKSDTSATINISNFSIPAELSVLAPIAKAKPGRVVNLVGLSDATVKLLIDDGFIIPLGIRWALGTIPGAGTGGQSNIRDVALTVRVPYDQPATGLDGKPFTITDNDYDFTVAGGATSSSLISALYGTPPPPLLVTLTNTLPTAVPHLSLNKSAKGDPNLNNSSLHGNGFSNVAGVGDVVTVAEHHGVDYELTYRNDLDQQGMGADAHGVVLHDVIPQGMTLCGFFKQRVNGSNYGTMFAGQFTFYDVNGVIIPGVDPNTNQNNMTLVRSMDIRLGSVSNITFVPRNTYGTVRYTCEPSIGPAGVNYYQPNPALPGYYGLPGVVHSFGGYVIGQGPSAKGQGFYLSTTDQYTPVAGQPVDRVVRVVSDVSWNFPTPGMAVNDSQPFDVVPFDFMITQNGDVTAANSIISFGVPQGVTLLTAFNYKPHANAVLTFDKNTHQVADGSAIYDFRPQLLVNGGSGSPLLALVTGANVQIALGNFAGHTTQTVRVFFVVNGPTLDPAIKAAKFRFGPTNAHITGSYSPAPNAAKAGAGRITAAAKPTTPQTVDAAAAGEAQMKVHDLNPPKLGITRSAPFSVKKGGQFTYVISAINTGDSAATNLKVGMQIPYRTDFAATTGYIVVAAASGNQPSASGSYSTSARSGNQLKPAGGSLHAGVDVVTWTFPSLPPLGKATVTITVNCDARFADEPIQDHSAYVSADNSGTVHIAAADINTWIYGKTLNDSKIAAAQAFFGSQGITITPELEPLVANVAKSINEQSHVRALAALDGLEVRGTTQASTSIVALGKGMVFVVSNDGGSLIAAGAGNVVSNDGGSYIGFGPASAFSVKNVGGNDSSVSGTRTCSFLLDNISKLVAAGAGNLIAAGAGNLVTDAGSQIVSNHPGGGFLENVSQLKGSAVQVDGSSVVSNDGGSFLAAGAALISQDGSGLISQDGAGLISQDGAGIVSHDAAGFTNYSKGGK